MNLTAKNEDFNEGAKFFKQTIYFFSKKIILCAVIVASGFVFSFAQKTSSPFA
jgi:hypothetical protein